MRLISNVLGTRNLAKGSCLFVLACVAAYVYITTQGLTAKAVAFGFGPGALSAISLWQLIFANISHVTFQHLFWNMWFFLLMAPLVERGLGCIRFLLLCLASAVGGCLGEYLIYGPGAGGYGASAVVYGVMGAFLIPKQFNTIWVFILVAVCTLVAMETQQLMEMDNIGHAAHVGGFFGGFATKCLFEIKRLRNKLLS